MNKGHKAGTYLFDGVPCFVPNDTYEGDGFYISYNKYDTSIYGDVTTALVLGQMEHFYILNGDHRENYFNLIPEGFDACLKYFESHGDEINKFSERRQNQK